MERTVLLLCVGLLVLSLFLGCNLGGIDVGPGDGNGGDGGGSGDGGGDGGGGDGGGDNGGGGGDGGGDGGETANTAPELSALTADPGTDVAIAGQVTLTATATDADGDTISYVWEANGGTVQVNTENHAVAVWVAPVAAGNYRVTCTASDGRGGSDEERVVLVVPNANPVISSLRVQGFTGSQEVWLGPGQRLTLECTATDANNDTLRYEWTATSGTFSGTGATTTWTAPEDAGEMTLTCTASDVNWGQDSAHAVANVWETGGFEAPID